jgi:xylulokinase
MPPGAEDLLFLPYLSGERTPHLDSRARGTFVGLTARHAIPHMTRAVMEGVVFSLGDSLEIMRELDAPVEQVRATGGGTRSRLWRHSSKPKFTASPSTARPPTRGRPTAQRYSRGCSATCGRLAPPPVRLREEVTEPDAERSRIYEEHYLSLPFAVPGHAVGHAPPDRPRRRLGGRSAARLARSAPS